jgi:hypothetical protein
MSTRRMNGCPAPQPGQVCRHAWLIIFQQSPTLVLECEFCPGVVSCEVGHHHEYEGHSFAFRVARGKVSGDELRELGNWFARQVGEHHVMHMDMQASRRHRRRSPVRAA